MVLTAVKRVISSGAEVESQKIFSKSTPDTGHYRHPYVLMQVHGKVLGS